MSEVAIPNNIPTQLDANMARVAHFDPTGGRLVAWATALHAAHQMAELVAIGHTSKSQALAILDMAGSLTKQRETA